MTDIISIEQLHQMTREQVRIELCRRLTVLTSRLLGQDAVRKSGMLDLIKQIERAESTLDWWALNQASLQ